MSKKKLFSLQTNQEEKVKLINITVTALWFHCSFISDFKHKCKKSKFIWSNIVNYNSSLFLFQWLPDYPLVCTMNVSTFGPAVWPAKGNIYIYECLVLIYRWDWAGLESWNREMYHYPAPISNLSANILSILEKNGIGLRM